MKSFPGMASPDAGILSRIAAHKREELRSRLHWLGRWERLAGERVADRRDFAGALRARRPAVISELKKASPSRGLLMADFRPRALAAAYQAGGAAALSVLTDEKFFQGSLEDLEAARSEVGIPVLRKDFTLEEYHVIEAAAHGADAVLLIAALHPAARLRQLRELAESYRLAALVEVHNEEEAGRAVESGATLIGVNNRDLGSFEVSLSVSLRLAGRIPDGVVKVSESGIHSAEDIRLLLDAGYQAFLVGEHLVRAADPGAALQALLS